MANFVVFQEKINRNDYTEGIIKLALELRKSWRAQDLKFQEFKDGMVHKTICCYDSKKEDKFDALVFRLFPDGDLFAYIEGDETKVVVNLQLANYLGNGAQLLATFANGTVCAYIGGATMISDELKDLNNMRQLMDNIARLHLVDYRNLKLLDFHGKPTTFNEKFTFIENCLAFLKNVPKTSKDQEKRELLQKYFKIEDLRNDVAYVEEYIQKAKLPLAFVHTDVHRNNIIVDKSTGKITLIDFDLACVGFESFDIACFLDGDPQFERNNPGLDEEKYLTRIKCYLEAKHRHQGKEGPSEYDIKKLYLESKIVYVLTLLPLSLWPLVEVEANKEFDFWGLAYKSRKWFLEKKPSLETLLKKYLDLKKSESF